MTNESQQHAAKLSASWHSYPSIYAMGHKALDELLHDRVIVQEKVDGSQFSFGRFDGELKVRSKGKTMEPEAPESLFKRAVDHVMQLNLHDGWTYRGECLDKPHHNVLTYDRVPEGNVILFDINDGMESYLSPADVVVEAQRVGLECVPLIWEGKGVNLDMERFKLFLEYESCLGGTKVEGVVLKPEKYNLFGRDKKVLMGKFVSEAFKEKHADVAYGQVPKQSIVDTLVQTLRTEARWQKSVQHLREKGELQDSPKDIGILIQELRADVEKEEAEYIAEILLKTYINDITRGVIRGFPEWYKEQLLASALVK